MGMILQNGKIFATGKEYHKYSTDERVVGEWIDGKTIYEKTIVDNTSHSAGSNAISTGILDADEIISINGIASYADHSIWFPLPLGDDTSSLQLSASCVRFGYFNKSSGNMTMFIGSNFASMNVIDRVRITIRYTKIESNTRSLNLSKGSSDETKSEEPVEEKKSEEVDLKELVEEKKSEELTEEEGS